MVLKDTTNTPLCRRGYQSNKEKEYYKKLCHTRTKLYTWYTIQLQQCRG